MKKWRWVALSLAVVMLLGVVGCKKPVEVKQITIGTASVGGAFYPIGMALAKIWNDNVPNTKSVAIATAGSPQNVDMMRTKEMEASVLRSLEGYKAIRGESPYTEKMPWMKALTGPLYNSGMQIVALKNKGISTIYDFKGRKIAVGPIGSGGEIDAREVLSAHGLNYWDRKDLTPEYVEAGQAVEMMNDGLIDGAILGLTIGAAAIAELMLTGKVIMLPIDDEALAKMQEAQPFIRRYVIKANTYTNMDYDVPTSGSAPVIIAVREDVITEQQAYLMTKAIYEHVADMKASASIMKDFAIEDCALDLLVPFHPGSIKYLKEKGILK